MNRANARSRAPPGMPGAADPARVHPQAWQAGYAYYGNAGNMRALQQVHRFAVQYWRKTPSRRSRKGYVLWEVFYRIMARFRLQRP